METNEAVASIPSIYRIASCENSEQLHEIFFGAIRVSNDIEFLRKLNLLAEFSSQTLYLAHDAERLIVASLSRALLRWYWQQAVIERDCEHAAS